MFSFSMDEVKFRIVHTRGPEIREYYLLPVTTTYIALLSFRAYRLFAGRSSGSIITFAVVFFIEALTRGN